MHIPIFPLPIVVFPGSKYPLHIFEERYKKMIGKCLAEKLGFGIVSKISDEISNAGVYVEIADVLNVEETGELDIVVKGTWRFKMANLDLHPDGYHLSEVERFEDENSSYDTSLFSELKDKVHEVLKQVNYDLNQSFWDSIDKSFLKSFKIAEKSGLSLSQQQELLTLADENKRLIFLIEHFNKLSERFEENIALKKIILGDGFIN
jgi:ATP-dependent Lon protease